MNGKDKEKIVEIVTSEYVKLQYHCADSGKRVIATLIDWAIIYVIDIILVLFFIDTLSYNHPWMYPIYIFLSIFTSTFSAFCEAMFNGQTIGKKIMKIRVISSQCTPPNMLECFLRWILFPVDFWVGLFIIGKYNGRLGDLASGCHVVYEQNVIEEKVEMSKDFAYINPNYKVKYPAVTQLSENEIASILKVAYVRPYRLFTKDMCERLKKKLNGTKFRQEGTDLLKQVVQDYKYLTQQDAVKD